MNCCVAGEPYILNPSVPSGVAPPRSMLIGVRARVSVAPILAAVVGGRVSVV